MNGTGAHFCFATPLQPLQRLTLPKQLQRVSLRPCMKVASLGRRYFLRSLPVLIALYSTRVCAQSHEIEDKGEAVSPSSQVNTAQEQRQPDIDPSTFEPEFTDRAFLDISVNDRPPKRLTVGLYGTIAPKTVANFLALCENGYANTKVYRIVPGLTVQLGDVLNNNGKSGRAATEGGWLEAETFRITHSIPGIVSMVTRNGRVDSRFFIATRKGDSKYLDGKYVAFGRVIEGLEFLDEIEREGEGFVRKPVRVVASGVLR